MGVKYPSAIGKLPKLGYKRRILPIMRDIGKVGVKLPHTHMPSLSYNGFAPAFGGKAEGAGMFDHSQEIRHGYH